MQNFRITFSASTVAPIKPPSSVRYIIESIEYDRLVFAALVEAGSDDAACDRISELWTDAKIRRIEAGAMTLPGSHIGATYGRSTLSPPTPRRLREYIPGYAFFAWAFS